MAIEIGVDSYADIAGADLYFAKRIHSTLWFSSATELKEQALVTATNLLEQKVWAGEKVSSTQLLAYPRVAVIYDEVSGEDLSYSGTPDAIKQATYELAYHLLTDESILTASAMPQELSIGPIKIKYPKATPVIPSIVSSLIANYEVSGNIVAGNSWWRAW